MKKLFFLTLMTCLIQPALAKVYKCTKGSSITYVGQPTKGCVPIGEDKTISTYTPSSSSLPNQADEIEPDIKASDNHTSQRALQAELLREQNALVAAQKALSDGREIRLGNERNYAKYQARIEQLQNTVKEKQERVRSIQDQLNYY